MYGFWLLVSAMSGKIFICALLLLPLVVTAEPLNDWRQSAFILNSFEQIALKNEYRAHNGKVRKWRQPVRIWLDHRVADQALHDQLVSLHVEDLARITGHDIQLVSQRAQANVVLVFARYAEMAEIALKLMGQQVKGALKEALCLAKIRTNGQQEIIAASIIIPVDQARSHGKLVSCIVEETTQILGLVNDSAEVYPSIFNDLTPNDLLTGLDYLLLKMLYDERIEAGMDATQARRQAALLIDQFQRDGEVERAIQEVRKGRLYELLGY